MRNFFEYDGNKFDVVVSLCNTTYERLITDYNLDSFTILSDNLPNSIVIGSRMSLSSVNINSLDVVTEHFIINGYKYVDRKIVLNLYFLFLGSEGPIYNNHKDTIKIDIRNYKFDELLR